MEYMELKVDYKQMGNVASEIVAQANVAKLSPQAYAVQLQVWNELEASMSEAAAAVLDEYATSEEKRGELLEKILKGGKVEKLVKDLEKLNLGKKVKK